MKNHFKVIISVLALFAFVFFSVLYFFRPSDIYAPLQEDIQNKKETILSPVTSLTPSAIYANINFIKTGNLVNTDPVISTHGPDFSLLYEEPGKPALKVNLKFSRNSMCDLGEGFKSCLTDKLRVGDRVNVKGVEKNKQVEVVELKKQTQTSLSNPASVYCEEQGGKVEMRKDNQGNETGYCVLASGMECEEWSFYRKECRF